MPRIGLSESLVLLVAVLHGVGVTVIYSLPNSVSLGEDTTDKTEPKKFEDADFWRSSAAADLSQKLDAQRLIGRAQNVILFLGDGWDLQTLTAARILKGQQVDHLEFGEEAKFHMESFQNTGLSKTYCVDSQVADSACSATAYLGGVKTNIGMIGVTPNIKRYDCPGQQDKANHVASILAWAQAAGKATGIVTTTKITDASPSGTYGHVANRDWECDVDVVGTGNNPDSCDDLAEQLILLEPGKNIDVILGGGRRKFLPKDVKDSEGFQGQRDDGKNLIESWKSQHENGVYVETASDLSAVDASVTKKLLGLFATEDLAYYHEQKENGDPSLSQMTQKAIEILSQNENGYFLFVEGGRIDHAHHDNWSLRSLWETVEFDRAIQLGDEFTDDTDTLIVVTADHGHTMTFAGYPHRGNDIGGVAGKGDDGLPYSTLNYANGPGFKPFVNNTRYNISQDNLHDLKIRKVPLVPLASETHGGQDVQILAKGPFAHLLTGVHEQNYIPYVMAYASCIGNGRTYCSDLNTNSYGASNY